MTYNRRIGALIGVLIMSRLPVSPQERSQARSMVISRFGIVGTSQTLASQAGADVLERGGSAMDAAIAANAVMGVVEPMSCGIGGDLFAIHWNVRTGRLTALNASGWAPKGLTVEFLKAKNLYTMPQDGIQSVSVPGCVEGWAQLHKKFGRLPWADIFRPAIYYARNGFPVTEIIHEHWKDSYSTLNLDENGRRIFLRDGVAPAVGEVFKNPDLAKALNLVATGGADSYYRGPIAKAILRTSDKLGGSMAAADLAEFRAEWAEPIAAEYRGWKVYELPPNGQGMAALEMLNILETFPLTDYHLSGVEAMHWKIEAQKLAYADLQRYLGDPRFGPVPVEQLISKPYAAERAKLINGQKAACDSKPGNPLKSAGDTIYLSVVDREGNIVSLIQSLYLSFGSGILADGYGFHLQNRAGLFDLDAASPNVLAPRKRPFHTIIPGFMEKDDMHIGFGIMGGLNQAQAHAQFVSNVIDGGMNLQAALESPRFTKLDFGGCNVYMERRVPQEVRDRLTDMGHVISVLADYSGRVGGGQAVMHDSKMGINYGASSPRKDGAAVPESPPYFREVTRRPPSR
jgi:gamma-glutamyltranspeptidase/glutathione hydrolase